MNAVERWARAVTRREALIVATQGALGLATSRAAGAYRPSHAHDYPAVPNLGLSYRSPRLTPYVDALPIAPRRAPGGIVAIAESRHRFHRDLPAAPSWGYDGLTHLGPTFEAHTRVDVVTTFENRLRHHILARDIDTHIHGASALDRTKPQTALHLHGAPNRPADDGHPMTAFRSGERRDYRFNHPGEATGLWYHDHAMGTTRLSVYAGLAGHYLVRDDFDTGLLDNPLGLPAGDHEIPLLINDKVLNADGTLRYQGTPLVPQDTWGGGLCGDVILVNGKVWPYLSVDRSLYRFRVLNGTQLNDYRLQLSTGEPFWVIGSDGGLLDQPCLVQELDVACGERYDLLVDFSRQVPGSHVDLINTMPIAWAGQLVGAVQVRKVMRFNVGDGVGAVRDVPTSLRGAAGLPILLPAVPAPSRVRTATLNATADLARIRWVATLQMSLNNLRFSDGDFDLPEQGTTEQWDLVNCDLLAQFHAIHVHLIQFRVLGRQDFDVARYTAAHPMPAMGHRWAPPVARFLRRAQLAPAPYERGWKDTVRCPPGQVTRVAVRWPTADELGFDPDASFTASDGSAERGYVWHCHLLDHEDHEMMQRLRVVRPGTPAPEPAPAHHHMP